MSEVQTTQQLILDSAEKIFADHCTKQLLDAAENGQFAQTLWAQISANGFNQLGTTASGTTAQEMYAFIMQCGRFAVPLPIADTLLVNSWLEPGEGLYSVGLVEDGQIRDVPWGRKADKVVGVCQDSNLIYVVEEPQIVAEQVNLAGEPRDTVALPDRHTHPDCRTRSVYATCLNTRQPHGGRFANLAGPGHCCLLPKGVSSGEPYPSSRQSNIPWQ